MTSHGVSQPALFLVGFLSCLGAQAAPSGSVRGSSWSLQMRQSGDGPIDVKSERSCFDEDGIIETQKKSGILELDDSGCLIFKDQEHWDGESNPTVKGPNPRRVVVQNIDDRLREISEIINGKTSKNEADNYRKVKERLGEIQRLSGALFLRDEEEKSQRSKRESQKTSPWFEKFQKRWEKIFGDDETNGLWRRSSFPRGYNFWNRSEF